MRLTRIGAKGKPSYRVVVADSESPRDGKFLEILGNYDPEEEPRRGDPERGSRPGVAFEGRKTDVNGISVA